MRFRELFKNKQFLSGLIFGLIISAIVSIVIIWTINQNINIVTTTSNPIDNSGKLVGDETGGLVREITDIIKKKNEVEFLGMQTKGEMSLKPTLLFTFSEEISNIFDQEGSKLINFTPPIEGSFHWAKPSTLAFTVDKPLLANTKYQLKMNEEIFKSADLKLKGKLAGEFVTEGQIEAELIGMLPKGEVDLNQAITFSFSKDVADLDQVGKNFQDTNILFQPEIRGSYRWINLRQLKFFPEEPFHPATDYKIIINPEIAISKAFYLKKEQIVEFSTEKFKVLSTKLTLSKTDNKFSELNARLVFNYSVKAEELEKYLKLFLLDSGTEQPLHFKLTPREVSEEFDLVVTNLKRSNEKQVIKLEVNGGLICENGSVGLEDTYSETVYLSALDPIKVYHVFADRDYQTGKIGIEFSRKVDEESIGAFISVTPEISYKIEVYGDRVYLKSDHFKSGETFEVTLKSGLPAINGGPLNSSFKRIVRIPDLSPLVRFEEEGNYLSNKGSLNLNLETINVDEVNVSIYKVFANNLVHFLNSNSGNIYSEQMTRLGNVIQEFSIDIDNIRNEQIKTKIPLKEYLASDRKGIFQLVIRDAENYWLNATKMVIATDIGIVTKQSSNELLVWVNSLKTLEPINKAKVILYSYNNQILAQGETNSQGIVRFNELKSTFDEFDPYLVYVEAQDDFSFLKLNDGRLDLTDFDVMGRSYLQEGYEAYLYTDRGVYRPNDQVNLVAIIRGEGITLPLDFPVRLRITDPAGNIYRELVQNTGEQGILDFVIDLPDFAKTGKYTCDLFAADTSIGQSIFNVEEFMPDRIKVEVKPDQDSYSTNELAQIMVRAINLFGPPAVGREVELSVKLDSVNFNPQKYRSFTFGDQELRLKAIEEEIGATKLDDNGEYVFDYRLPADLKPGNMMKAVFKATVHEEGGRAVSTYQVADFHPYDSYIGLRRTGDYYGKIDEPYQIQYIEVNQNSQPIEGSFLQVKVYRVIWHTIWRRDSRNHWYYETEKELEEVLTQDIVTGKVEREFSFTPRDYGEYRIIVSNQSNGTQSAINFYATGWGYSPWSLTNPTQIELTLNKDSYEIGELAQIQVKAPFAGKALVTIERENIYDMQIVEFKENTGLIAVNIKEDWKPNVYVSVQLIRSLEHKGLDKHSPVRAYGTISLPINSRSNRLDLEINSVEEIRPNKTLEVAINVQDITDEEVYVTLTAVDEGILQLTNYLTPNPYRFFYGKKKLDVESFDLYNLILPEAEKVIDPSSPGGGYAETIAKENLNPISVNRVKPVSLYSGIVKLDETNSATIELDVPQFNGSLRLMAIASAGANFGSQQKKVLVRDPIVITSTYPRFAAGRDKFQVPVAVYNGTGRQGEFTIKLKIDGPVRIIDQSENSHKIFVQNIYLANEEEKMVYFDLEALNTSGKVKFQLEVNGNGEISKEETEIAVRPSVPRTRQTSGGKISGESISEENVSEENVSKEKIVDLNFDDNWLKGTGNYQLTISPFPVVQFSGSLKYLLNYPYGCAEQTTSRLFPLLFFDQLAANAEPDLFSDESADYYIREGLFKLQTMQLDDGSFAYWPEGNYTNTWASLYVSHFMIEAQNAGYQIANNVYDKMLKFVRQIGKKSADSPYELQNKVYALYVLSLAGMPDKSNMAYIKNHQWSKLYEDSRVLLAAAYYYSGERDQMKKLLPFSFSYQKVEAETGGNFNSSIRRDAIILSVLADVEPTHSAIPVLIKRLSKTAKAGQWGTTQENAFAFMAIGKILQSKGQDRFDGKVLLNNREIGTFTDKKDLVIKDEINVNDQLNISFTGEGEAYYFLEVSGIPLAQQIDEIDNGVKIRRIYLDKHGKPLDLSAVKQGEMIIAKITVESLSTDLKNVVVVDMLPAGLEIENPRLESRAKIAWIDDYNSPIDYLDLRDDRLLLFTKIDSNKPFTFYYTLRAVTVGEFLLPPIKAECMYEPEIWSTGSAGNVQIIK